MNLTFVTGKTTWSDVNSLMGVNGKPDILFDYDDIHNAITNILTCPIGTRGWHPTFGSELPFLIWEPVDMITASDIKTAIITALARWEPRITLIGGQSSITPLSDGIGYSVALVYKVNISGSLNSFTFRLTR